MQMRSCYTIGNLGICSVFEIEQFILQTNTKIRQLGELLNGFPSPGSVKATTSAQP